MAYRAFKFTVSGKVQGVFYRVFTKDIAHDIGIVGWVANDKVSDTNYCHSRDSTSAHLSTRFAQLTLLSQNSHAWNRTRQVFNEPSVVDVEIFIGITRFSPPSPSQSTWCAIFRSDGFGAFSRKWPDSKGGKFESITLLRRSRKPIWAFRIGLGNS